MYIFCFFGDVLVREMVYCSLSCVLWVCIAMWLGREYSTGTVFGRERERRSMEGGHKFEERIIVATLLTVSLFLCRMSSLTTCTVMGLSCPRGEREEGRKGRRRKGI